VVVTILQVEIGNGFVRSFSLSTSDHNNLQVFLRVYSLPDWLGTGVLNSTSTVVTDGELCFCCLENRQLCDIFAGPSLQSSWISDVLSQYILSLTLHITMLQHYITTATISVITCCLSRMKWKGTVGLSLWSTSLLDKPQNVNEEA
jgi:hypothetical protein